MYFAYELLENGDSIQEILNSIWKMTNSYFWTQAT